MLSDVVHHVRGKGLVVDERSLEDPVMRARRRFIITLPLPVVRDDRSGRRVPVGHAIPPELFDTFVARCESVMDAVRDETRAVVLPFTGRPMESRTAAEMNAVLLGAERRAAYDRGPELWQIAALCFGLNPWALPEPAGLAT